MKKLLIGVSMLCVFSMGILVAYDQELIGAYSYAHTVGITTQSTIDAANMYGSLTRVAMAKMIANYAIGVLDKTPNTGKVCIFPDVSSALDAEYGNGVTKACQLGLMGINTDGTTAASFNPNGLVTRAQFGTVLSRAMYGDIHNTGNPYYVNHLAALNAAGVMKNISTPNANEQRGLVMLMMQRADETVINTGTDITKPTAKVIYSTTGSTSGNVTATLSGRSETITGVNAYTHIFTGNGTYTFTFSDVVGNTGSITATVANIIDGTKPTASVKYSTTGTTNGEVIATLTGRSETITGVNAYTRTFTGNGTYTFTFSDLAGNTGSVTATVANIVIGDVTKPTASVIYSTTGATNGDVIATLTGRSETITGVNAYTRTFTGNGTYTFTFSDLAGNTGSVTATVDNIDKIAPIATVALSPGNPGSGNYITGDIIATLTGRIGTITGVNAYAHTFTGNGIFTFTFSDLAGNLGFATGTVDYWTGA